VGFELSLRQNCDLERDFRILKHAACEVEGLQVPDLAAQGSQVELCLAEQLPLAFSFPVESHTCLLLLVSACIFDLKEFGFAIKHGVQRVDPVADFNCELGGRGFLLVAASDFEEDFVKLFI
jgi:hypothetical protein